jgi:hypothetical protein
MTIHDSKFVKKSGKRIPRSGFPRWIDRKSPPSAAMGKAKYPAALATASNRGAFRLTRSQIAATIKIPAANPPKKRYSGM